MFEKILDNSAIHSAGQQIHNLMDKAAQTVQLPDLDRLFADTLEKLQNTADFAGVYTALSESERHDFKAQVVTAIEKALLGRDVNTEAARKAFLESSFVSQIDGNQFTVRRNDATLLQLNNLDTAQGVNSATMIQTASIIIEAILLTAAIVGSAPEPSTTAINQATEVVAEDVAGSLVLQQSVANVVQANAKGGKWELAKSIFALVKDVYQTGLLMKTLKILFSGLSGWQYALMLAQVVGFIVAGIATDGVADVAKFVLVLGNAAQFIAKLSNMSQLKAMSATVKG